MYLYLQADRKGLMAREYHNVDIEYQIVHGVVPVL